MQLHSPLTPPPSSAHEPLAAVGDGVADDTQAIQDAMDRTHAGGGGRVVIPAGTYLVGTLKLRSGVHLHLEAAATIRATPDLDRYDHYVRPADNPEPQNDRWHRAVIVGDKVSDVRITGSGTLDGNRLEDTESDENVRGPHVVLLGECRDVVVRDIRIRDGGNYGLFLEYCRDVVIDAVRFHAGYDGLHMRGMPGRPCENVVVRHCDFRSGDDAIAGRYWKDCVIHDCRINSACNGIRLIGPTENLHIHDNVIYGPGRHPHIHSGRHNMLSAIKLQYGQWEPLPGPSHNVVIANNTARDVKSVLCVNSIEACPVGSVTVENFRAERVYGPACCFDGQPGVPIDHLTLSNVHVQFARSAGYTAAPDMPPEPIGKGVRETPAWGLWVEHVRRLDLDRVVMTTDQPDPRAAHLFRHVGETRMDRCSFTAAPTT